MTDDAVTTSVVLPEGSASFRAARRISRTLKGAGHDAWIVGGSVRDLVMGIEPHDWDIATSARPEQVLALFDRTIPVGVKFGVVIVRMAGMDFEVATFRADCGYTDGRRPDGVRFTDLREDVLRRDFTVNGLAMDADTGVVIDLVGGMADIGNRLIRAIGDPELRFGEDRLRELRAVRFAAVTGFAIEPATLDAIRRNAVFIGSVSVERIAAEYTKMLTAGDPAGGFRLAVESGLLAETIPELCDPGENDLAIRTLDLLNGSGACVMWAAVLAQLGPAGAITAMHRLKQSNRDAAAVSSILEIAADAVSFPPADLAVEKRLLGRELIAEGLRLAEARFVAAGKSTGPIITARKKLAGYSRADLHPAPLVTGNDCLAAGAASGPGIARTLREIEDEQLRGAISTRAQALEYIRKSLDRR